MNKKLIRITTVPLALRYLLPGQMKFMKDNGFDVIMISADGVEINEVIENEQCRHIIVPMSRRITPLVDFKCLIQLIKIFRNERPDIVHTHTPKAGLLGMLAAKICRVKIRIHTIAGLRFTTSKWISRQILIRMEKITCYAANEVWPNSFSLMQAVKHYKLAPPAKLKVIASGSTNGIDLNRFSVSSLQSGVISDVKQQMKYNPDLEYLLFVGRIVKDKGVEELVQVFADLYMQNNRLRLILVGSFEEKLDPLNENTKQLLNTHTGIIHIAWSNSVEYFMHLSLLLIHPSYREGFPNVLLQAGAMGCPIVCSAIEGNVDVIEHGKTGLLFKVTNRESLYQQLTFALNNPLLMKEYANTLKLNIHKKFDRSIVQAKILEQYNNLIAKANIK